MIKSKLLTKTLYVDRNTENKNYVGLESGTALIASIVQTNVTKLDAHRLYGYPLAMEQHLFDADFQAKKTLAGYTLAISGKVFCTYVRYKGNLNYTIDFFNISENKHTLSLNDSTAPLEVYGYKVVGYDESNDEEKSVYIKFFLNEKGKYCYEQYYDDSYTRLEENGETMETNLDFIPGMIIRNNAWTTGDFDNVVNIVNDMNEISKTYGEEYENSKQLWSENMYGKNYSNKDDVKDVSRGKRNIEVNNIDGNIISGSTPLPSQQGPFQTTILALTYLEQSITQYTLSERESDSTGTNKHSLQVGMLGQNAAEYVNYKRRQRENDYTRFFRLIVPKMKFDWLTDTVKEELKTCKIVFEVSEFQTAKIDAVLSSRYANKEKESHANMYDSQATLFNSQTSRTEKETSLLTKDTTNAPNKGVNKNTVIQNNKNQNKKNFNKK